jgi:hypothetical protein
MEADMAEIEQIRLMVICQKVVLEALVVVSAAATPGEVLRQQEVLVKVSLDKDIQEVAL